MQEQGRAYIIEDFLPPTRHEDYYEYRVDKRIKIKEVNSEYCVVVELVRHREYAINGKVIHSSVFEHVSDIFSSTMHPQDALLLEGIYTSSSSRFCVRALEILRLKYNW